MTSQQPIFTRSVNTESLISYIRQHKDSTVITYEGMNTVLGKPGAKRPIELSSALKALLEEQFVFETIFAEGIKLATGPERLNLSKSHVHKTRRATRRVMKKLATVKPEEVDSKEYNSACARVALIAAATDKSIQKSVEEGKIVVLPQQPLTRQQLQSIFS